MPNKHFYFAMGALSGTAISYVIRRSRFWLLKHTHWMNSIYKWNRHWFLYFLPFCVIILGLIALAPDIIHGFGILPKEVTRSRIFDLFFFHSYFEYIEDHNAAVDQLLNWVGEILLLVISTGVLLFYALYLRKLVYQRKKQK